MSPLLLGLGAAAFGILIYLVRWYFAANRTEALAALAPGLGMKFDAAPTGLDRRYAHFALFNKGHFRSAYNKFEGRKGAFETQMFDYAFSIGRHQYRQTVMAFASDRWNLPAFQMVPQGLVQAVQKLFSSADIDFENAPEFSRQYYLTGTDRASVVAMFDQRKLEYFARLHGMYVEGSGRELIVYQHNERMKPEHVAGALERAIGVANVFLT